MRSNTAPNETEIVIPREVGATRNLQLGTAAEGVKWKILRFFGYGSE
jgi:hypothetical protein